MIVYNTTFHVAKEIEKEGLEYLKKIYIPQALASGFLMNACLRRVLHTAPDDGASFSVQFHVKNVDTLNYWLQKEGNAFHQELVDRFGHQVAGFSTLLEEIELEE